MPEPSFPRCAAPDTLCSEDYVNNTDIVCADDDLHFLIYPQGDSSFTLYDDTAVECHETGDTTSVRLTSVPRGILLQLLGREPSGIQRDGVSLNKVAAVDVFDTADTGWRYDTAGRFTYVKFTHPGGSANVVVQH